MYILILCQHYRGKLQLVQEHGGLTSFAYSSERVKKTKKYGEWNQATVPTGGIAALHV